MSIEELRKELIGLVFHIECHDMCGRDTEAEGTIVAVEKYAVMHNKYGGCIVRVNAMRDNGEPFTKELLYEDMWHMIKYHSISVSYGDGSVRYKYELRLPRNQEKEEQQ